ncbi:hypothetical protein T11_9042 [Trichinella zimbabwensis]|uniref:Uncharacterized protein n=1 Tax=Trichinella zimbabwensis TaxID=268475 RepID=A0A0V1HBD8_9BILA|nr:hypothetical protein T11_9042 [Trichinella zimbabwensis]
MQTELKRLKVTKKYIGGEMKLVQLNFMHLLYAFCAHDMRRNACVHAVRGNVIAMLLVLRIV